MTLATFLQFWTHLILSLKHNGRYASQYFKNVFHQRCVGHESSSIICISRYCKFLVIHVDFNYIIFDCLC